MEVPGKFPPGTRFHEDRSASTWVEFPDGSVFKLNEESDELVPRKALPVGSLIGSFTEAQFLRFAKNAAE
jgi:hypothetical protein